jgi:hypothetical protein
MSGAIVNVAAVHTQFDPEATIGANTHANIVCDGFSWGTLANLAITDANPPYGRTFLDIGADTYGGTLTASGLAIGTSVILDIPMPGVRAGEYAICTLLPTVADDFEVIFHNTITNVVRLRLRNLSRVSTDFAEPCEIVCFHNTMTAIAIPPP